MTMRNGLVVASGLVGVVLAIAIFSGSFATAEPAKEAKPADPKAAAKAPAQPEFKLPPGWTPDDLKACMEAGTPGKNQALLGEGAGAWTGKQTMWMGPDSEPVKSEVKSNVTKILDGRFVRVEMQGDMPGMGPYHGIGVYGFDNVAGKFVSAWIDNHSTGIMQGTGELSADGKTHTWRYTFNCPLTKKPAVMREVETVTGSNTKVMEMFTTEPKTGKEYKMMRVEFTRTAAPAAAPTSAAPAR